MGHRRRLDRDDARTSRLMIVRRWSARLDPGNVDAYVAHFARSVKPALCALSGFVDAMVLARRIEGETPPTSEIVVESRWTSLEAIHIFAGADVTAAAVEPDAAALFREYDARVLHYDVIE